MNYNYFMTPVGPNYWKTFGRNLLIGFWLLFSFYGASIFLTDRYSSELLVKILWMIFILLPAGLIAFKFYRRFRK